MSYDANPPYDFWVSHLFCVPQRIGIFVGWVDVKGFLIVSALRKSTHHSRESTGKQIESICLSFWWVGYCWMSIG